MNEIEIEIIKHKIYSTEAAADEACARLLDLYYEDRRERGFDGPDGSMGWWAYPCDPRGPDAGKFWVGPAYDNYGMEMRAREAEFLTPAGAVKIAGCTARTIRRAIRAGALPAISPGRALLIRREALDAWLAKPRPRRGRPPERKNSRNREKMA